MDKVILEHHCDVVLDESEEVLALAYLNSFFPSGLRNVLDRAILSHPETERCAHVPEHAKVDKIPFDFQRRIMSVVVRTPEKRDLLIAEGAPEAILPRCARFELDRQLLPIKNVLIEELEVEHRRLSADGFRVLAVATRDGAPRAGPCGKEDERELVLRGSSRSSIRPRRRRRPRSRRSSRPADSWRAC